MLRWRVWFEDPNQAFIEVDADNFYVYGNKADFLDKDGIVATVRNFSWILRKDKP